MGRMPSGVALGERSAPSNTGLSSAVSGPYATIACVTALWDTVQPVTVRQLLALDVLSGATLLGGEAGLDRRVREAAVTTGVASPHPLEDAVVIMDGSGLRNDTYQIDLALRRIAEAAGSALIVVAPSSTIGVATARLANKVTTPLLSVADGDVLTLCDSIREIVLTPQAYVSQMIVGSLETLRKATDAAGVSGALSAVAELLACTASLVGVEGGVVAGHELDPPLVDRDRIPVPMQTRSGTLTQVVHPISLAPRERPSFWLVLRRLDATETWTGIATDVLQIAAWSVGTRMVADRLQRERDARFRLGVLNAITATGEQPEPALLEQIGVLGWQVGGWCSAIHVQVAGEVDQLRVLALTDDLVRALAAVGISSPVVERPDGWTFWTVATGEPATSYYLEVAQALRTASSRFVASHSRVRLLVGIGRPYQSVLGLKKSLAEAHEASTIAMAGGEPFAVQHIDELGVKRILLGWYASETFAEFARTLLGPLIDEDPHGELLPTLEAFLDNQSSPTLTGSQLNIHRNTVLNRMEKARSLLAVDLDHPDERLAVQLACRVIRLRGTNWTPLGG